MLIKIILLMFCIKIILEVLFYYENKRIVYFIKILKQLFLGNNTMKITAI